MQTFFNDLRYGARLLRRSPGFTLVAVAALAIGIGANLTIFGFASALLLRPPRGVTDPARVVRVFTNRFSNTPYANYVAYRERNSTFLALAAFRAELLSLRAGGAAEQRFGFAVSGNYFSALGVPAAIGRPILPEDDGPESAGVVLLSDRFWRVRFGADPQAIGRAVMVNGNIATIIGVAPVGFTGVMAPLVPDFWIPFQQSRRVEMSSVQIIGRLRPDVTIGQAQADLMTLATQLADARAGNTERPMLTVYPARTLAPELSLPAAVFAAMLLAVVGLVLLIACVNIANLQLARSGARQREIGVRLALGASRWRLVRQMLTESLLLSAAGGVAAAALAYAIARPAAAAVALVPVPIPVGLDFALDWRVAAAAAALSMMTTLAFGLVPALQASKRDVLPALKEGGATATPSRARLRGALVTAQAALSTLLLVVASLLVRAVFSAEALDRGLAGDDVLTASIDLESSGYTAERGLAFYERLLERLAATPGIISAAVVDIVPLTLSNRLGPMIKETQDRSPNATEALMVYSNATSPGHFRTLGIPIVAGRDFDARDRARATPVAIVNQTLARRFWPDESPVGKRLRYQGNDQSADPWLEVIGVVRDSKYVTVGEAPKAFLYRPLAQSYTSTGNLLVKSAGDPMAVLAGVRASVEALDANLPLFGVMTFEAATGISLLPVQIAAAISAALGVLALALGAIGLYGVMSAVVRQRTREIGIRMALGAHAATVVRLVTAHGMRWTAIGVAVGLVMSFALARLIAGLLYGVSPTDATTFAFIPLLLASAAYAACYFPARRASRIDPLMALHEE